MSCPKGGKEHLTPYYSVQRVTFDIELLSLSFYGIILKWGVSLCGRCLKVFVMHVFV